MIFFLLRNVHCSICSLLFLEATLKARSNTANNGNSPGFKKLWSPVGNHTFCQSPTNWPWVQKGKKSRDAAYCTWLAMCNMQRDNDSQFSFIMASDKSTIQNKQKKDWSTLLYPSWWSFFLLWSFSCILLLSLFLSLYLPQTWMVVVLTETLGT